MVFNLNQTILLQRETKLKDIWGGKKTLGMCY